MTEPRDRDLPGWAKDASFGIFIHWGPYSVPAWAEPVGALGTVPDEQWFAHCAYAEWYANTIRIDASPAALHHAEVYGSVPYEYFLDQWRAEAYEPAEWARIFREVGADYVVPVTKHHDGVTLWDAPGSEGFNTVDRGPKRDLLGPLAEAVRAEGMRFGVYYSGGLDWSITDYPAIEKGPDISEFRPTNAEYAAYATEHVRNLIDRYQPSVLWNDIDWPDAGKADGTLDELITYYRSVVPDGIVNDRWGADVWDYRTSEYSAATHNETGIGWEHNRGLGFSFGYNRVEDESLTMTPREAAELYADVVSRGGRLLLNVGPDAAGRIPEVQLRTLKGVSSWMTELKPFTTDRRPVTGEEVAVTSAEDNWCRAWISGDRLVVVADRPEAVEVAANGLEVVSVALPEADR
ncbi:alpha-L-fucosidase [Glycomyces salinus]|uniref:alpha-L-fucosidase n=1 Tax=Glycomyces salinus TaxID=980294 RepID=UPI0018EAF446|nr:alpha-L-fucosidase [Glycomyces salinus]